LTVNESNAGKLAVLNDVFDESRRVVNLFIDKLWKDRNFSSRYVTFKVNTWLSARLQQALGKQALEIVKSQRKCKKKTKPSFTGTAFNLDSRFVDFQYDNNSFDIWIRLSSIGRKISLRLPAKKHRHFNKFYRDWSMKKSIRLCIDMGGNYYVETFFEKNAPDTRKTGDSKGIDIGYKKLIVSSDKEFLGDFKIYEKIARKCQGSKGFKKALVERDEEINKACKLLNLSGVRELVVENLKNVKRGSKGKIRKSFNNKLQRWSYPKVLEKLSMICEEAGIMFTRVNPAYTSQTCSACGFVDKKSRNGESFLCTSCGMSLDADFNASLNILHGGVYGLATT